MNRGPASVALSIAIIIAALLGLFAIDEFLLQKRFPAIDPEISLAQYREITQMHYERYVQWTIQDAYANFDWHARSSKILFWVSILVSVSGMCFAFWQFVEAREGDRSASEADEIELRTQMMSLAFKSRSVAALVLFVSLAYLLIYIVFVYPISFQPQSIGGLGETAQSDAIEPALVAGPIDKVAGPDVEEISGPPPPSPD